MWNFRQFVTNSLRRTRRGGGGEWMPPPQGGAEWMPPPLRFFLSFILSLRFIISMPDVFSSCSFIPCAHFKTSLVMVSCYGYERWRHKKQVVKPFSSANTCFSSTLSIIKVNLAGKIMRMLIYVIFHVKHKKLPFPAVLTWFLILGKQTVNRHFLWDKAFIYQ